MHSWKVYIEVGRNSSYRNLKTKLADGFIRLFLYHEQEMLAPLYRFKTFVCFVLVLLLVTLVQNLSDYKNLYNKI